MPGLRVIRTYRHEWLQSDLLAGISLAAVALPIGIAYAELAGFPAVAGIYSAILPAVAYALFGTSRQLVVNPDAAACAIVGCDGRSAGCKRPLPLRGCGGHADVRYRPALYRRRFGWTGVIADFLSRPILTGYLNGIALSIIAGQLGTLMGVQVPKGGFFRTIVEAFSRLGDTHHLTIAVGLGLFVLLRIFKHFWPRLPGPLIGVVFGIVLVYAMGLEAKGSRWLVRCPPGSRCPPCPGSSSARSGLWSRVPRASCW